MSTITLHVVVEETAYETPTEWRMLGAQGKADHVIELCRRHEVSPERLLEVGAGDGAILRCLADKKFCGQMHALEISQSGVDVILKQNIPGLISCQTFDGYNLPFEDKYFDLVILSHVLEHVEYERAVLREIMRVSKYQVIEIPMDCNALKDDAYHLLGPSYGHINAHTPDSLRFLLSTERFSVIDELLGQYSLELEEYNHFVNNNHERTPSAIELFRTRHQGLETQFNSLPRSTQEARAAYYAVLTKEEDADARLVRAMNAAKKNISSGQVQAARLIFNHYVPAARMARCALELAHATFDTNPKIALEFAERVLAIESSNADAQALKQEVLRNMSDNPAVNTPLKETPTMRFKEFVKYRFPRLAHILRELRR
jgi:ubiquinone/menaquinone biosynthesis C-methylase UbiE